MKCSLNEARSLSMKAAHGVGLPWGWAEEAAMSVCWLLERGWPGVDTLAACLTGVASGRFSPLDTVPVRCGQVWTGGPEGLFPIVVGTMVNDRAHDIAAGAPLETARLVYPILLLPFVDAASAVTGCALVLEWPGTRLEVHGRVGVHVVEKTTLLASNAAELCCRRLSTTHPAVPPRRTVAATDVRSDAWEALAEFARWTYVPSSGRSRDRGAGEGAASS